MSLRSVDSFYFLVEFLCLQRMCQSRIRNFLSLCFLVVHVHSSFIILLSLVLIGFPNQVQLRALNHPLEQSSGYICTPIVSEIIRCYSQAQTCDSHQSLSILYIQPIRGVRVTETTKRQDKEMDQSLVCLCWCAQETFAQVERRIFTYDQVMEK